MVRIHDREQDACRGSGTGSILRALINAELLADLDFSRRRAWMYRTVKNLYIDRKRRESFETVMEQMPEEGLDEAQYARIDDDQLLAALAPDERQLLPCDTWRDTIPQSWEGFLVCLREP